MIALSYSGLSTYQTCQRKYYYQYHAKVVPAARQLPLEFGHAWHTAMDAWFRTREVAQAVAAFDAEFTDDERDSKRTRATAKRMLERYAKKYAEEPFTVVETERFVSVELEPGVVWRGRIDKRLEWDGKPWIMDHKTTSSISSNFLMGFEPSLQMPGYVLAMTLTEGPVEDVLIDIAWVGKTEPREGDALLRYPLKVEAWKVEECQQTILRAAHEIAPKQAFEEFLPNWNACAQFGGCAYRLVCLSPATIRPKILEMQYTKKEDVDGDY